MTSKQVIKFLTVEEINQILNHLPDDLSGRRDKALMEVLFSTGMRISEALSLKRDQMIAGKTLELSIIGKGGYQRVVYFSPTALKAVFRYLAARLDCKPALFPITARWAQIMIKQRALEAGIKKFVSPHILRHSLATNMLGKGVDIRFISDFLGHRSLNNTMIYTHAVSSQLKKIHEEIYK